MSTVFISTTSMEPSLAANIVTYFALRSTEVLGAGTNSTWTFGYFLLK